ncbi:hypothetical protein N183_11960 [Sinorhizobium sp. Sb3]|uniref:hypothetical protein n=1 Tax=Sinorhizobium sp. Sb3 TaxID=1358417 RepID=UPI00071C84E5|nr:hypothetical protein [Sinorhizobium sp. Sb3]KSV84534.1 hypothetical protein N183_11960 [Sinorhizobium sp. Sb3]
MSQRFLPPLEADTRYRVAEFQSFSFGHRTLLKAVTGEDTSILHLHLSNRTTLDLPVSDEALQYLMVTLMDVFPQQAIDRVKERWPRELAPKE